MKITAIVHKLILRAMTVNFAFTCLHEFEFGR